ncbi:MAG: hypothetical protein JNJ83_00885 [Verrucomicrobiaceae bacterium]|nr:hypothetical protein [Verrucomicrobiaceae bacterium]
MSRSWNLGLLPGQHQTVKRIDLQIESPRDLQPEHRVGEALHTEHLGDLPALQPGVRC